SDLATLDALEFLRQPGQRIEVLQVGVIRTTDGRRYVEISPLSRGSREPRGVEATQEIPAIDRTVEPEPAAPEPAELEPVESALPEVAEPTEIVEPAEPEPAGPPVPESTPTGSAAPAPADDVETTQVLRRRAVAPPVARPAGTQSAAPRDDVPASPVVTEPSRARRARPAADEGAITTSPAGVPAVPEPAEAAGSAEPAGPTAAAVESAATRSTPALAPAPVLAPAGSALRPAATAPRETEELARPAAALADSWFGAPLAEGTRARRAQEPADGVAPTAGSLDAGATPTAAAADLRLARFAATLGEPIELVWVRLRRGERLTIALHPNGDLELPSGSRYVDLDRATTAVGGSGATDGWRVWRIGDDGPLLLDVVEDAQPQP
ncbi:MAG: hypothetical protein ACTMIR_06265, partial [Cellulomonadaceae bacterium]